MKLILVCFSLFFCIGNKSAFGQTKLDTIVKNHTAQIEEVTKKADAVQVDVNAIKVHVNTVKASVDALKTNVSKFQSNPRNHFNLGFIQWLLVFSPIFLFAFSLLVIRKKLAAFDLKDALTDSDLPKRTIPNPEYTFENITALATNATTATMIGTLLPPTIEVTANEPNPKSSSRYIAFITSTLTWVIILCLSCFFMYVYLSTNKAPDLSGLSSVMLALGIGVVPYAFNKVAAAIK